MLLWIGFAGLSAVVLALLLRPLFQPAAVDAATARLASSAVYRDQLVEIDADRERGLIPEADAEAAKVEVARRLLANDVRQKHAGSPAPASMSDRRLAGIGSVLAVAIPVVTLGIYLAVGAPGLPDQPLSARAPANVDTARVAELVTAVEARLRQSPDDGQGWDVIAPVYLRQGRAREAAEAYARAMRLLGETPRRLAGFAEATVVAHDGIVTEPARQAYGKLAKLEPQRLEPRFWLALADEQDGKLEAAATAYRALLQDGGAALSWRSLVQERLDAVQTRGARAPAAASQPGPSAADVEAAAGLSPDQRAQMIAGMVQGLSDRLHKDGRDLAGWQRLIRAYVVMGRKEDAVAALANARRNFPDEPQSLSTLGELARSLGLES